MRRHHRNRIIFAFILIVIVAGIYMLVRFIANRVGDRRETGTNVRTVYIDLESELENQAGNSAEGSEGDDMQLDAHQANDQTPETPVVTEPPRDPNKTYNDHIDADGYTQLNDYVGVVRTQDIDVLKANLAIYAEKDPRANKLLELPVDNTESIQYSLLRLAGNNPMTIGPVLDILEDDADSGAADAGVGAENAGIGTETAGIGTENTNPNEVNPNEANPNEAATNLENPQGLNSYETSLANDTGETIELNRPAPFFLQWDKRWADDAYGTSFLMLNGCVPVSLSMAISGVTGEFVSPTEIISHAGPDDVGPWGTAWAFVDRIPGLYGVGVTNLAYDQWSVNQALDQGKIILVSIGPGRFTFVGHFIAIVDYDDEGYIVNDPNSLENSLQKWSFEEIAPVANLWAIG